MPSRLLAGIAVSAAAVTLTAQEPQVFRGGVRTVPVFASVSDRDGMLVNNLKRSDFEVRDNGKVQEITLFSADAKPLSLLLLIDGSASMLNSLNSVVAASSSLVARMVPQDRMAVASFADYFQMNQPFTSDRQALLEHLEDPFNLRVAGETRLWEALTESVTRLSSEQGRRVVLVLTDGKEWTYDQGQAGEDGGSASLTRAPRSLLSLALERNVMIYAIAVWTKTKGGRTAERPSNSIETLAAETGGGYVEMRQSDGLNKLASDITIELHRQYVLGFTPQTLDGKQHRLDVIVKKPGLSVAARRSYFAPAGDKDH